MGRTDSRDQRLFAKEGVSKFVAREGNLILVSRQNPASSICLSDLWSGVEWRAELMALLGQIRLALLAA